MRSWKLMIFVVSVLFGGECQAQTFSLKKSIEPGRHKFELKNPEGQSRTITLRKREKEETMEVQRSVLVGLPMEFLALPTELPKADFVAPVRGEVEKSETVKVIMGFAGKVLEPIIAKAGFLTDFVQNMTCAHPETGEEIPIRDFLNYYIRKNGYVKEGYFSESDLDKDPVGVLLKLVLFDKWFFFEAKLIHGDDGEWYSVEDCLKGKFTSPYSQKAVASLKHAIMLQQEAKEYSLLKMAPKLKAYGESVMSYLDVCLFIIEANRSGLTKKQATQVVYERVRISALQGKIIAHYKTPLKVVVVDKLATP